MTTMTWCGSCREGGTACHGCVQGMVVRGPGEGLPIFDAEERRAIEALVCGGLLVPSAAAEPAQPRAVRPGRGRATTGPGGRPVVPTRLRRPAGRAPRQAV